MRSFSAFAIIVFTLGVCLNTFKFPLFILSHMENVHYKIFPWQTPDTQQTSSSSGMWLTLHLSTALLRLALTIRTLIKQNKKDIVDSRLVRDLDLLLHTIFFAAIFVNAHHFGQASIRVALVANLSLAIPGYLVYFSNLKYKHQIYFTIIATPILFEASLRLLSLFN